MNHSRIRTTDILNDACEMVPRAGAPGLGLLWLTALPLRFFQVHFVGELLVEHAAPGEGRADLANAAVLVMAALIPALYGRAVFVRACALGMKPTQTSPGIILRIPPVHAATYLYTSLLVAVLFFGLAPTLVLLPFPIALTGLAAATFSSQERLGLGRSLADLFGGLALLPVLGGMLLVFGAGLFVASVSLHAGTKAILDFGGWAAGVDVLRWQLAMDGDLYRLLLGAAAVLIAEPFWLAANVVCVNKIKARHTGEDLRVWFDEIRAENPA